MAALMRATAGTSPVDEIHHLTPDLTEKVTRRGMPDNVPRTWILTLRDRTHNVRTQFAGVEAIGGVQKN